MLQELPTVCDRGTQCNARGYKVRWNGHKPRLDTADRGVPIAALLSSASLTATFSPDFQAFASFDAGHRSSRIMSHRPSG
jgi:hypothetical protein